MGPVAGDIRLTTLLELLFERFKDVPFDFIFTTVWSLGILTSYRGMEYPVEMKLKILKELDKCEIPSQSLMNVPSLVFSIACMFNQNDVREEVFTTVRRISEIYMKEGILLMEPMHASTLLLGWSKINYHNEEFLHKI